MLLVDKVNDQYLRFVHFHLQSGSSVTLLPKMEKEDRTKPTFRFSAFFVRFIIHI